MIQFKSELGEITVSSAVFSNITGMAATNCFGVKGMAYRSMTDGLVHLLRREAMSKGVSITYHDDNSISIELHIIVENELTAAIFCGCHRAVFGVSADFKARRRLGDVIEVTHPADGGRLHVGE